MRKLIFVLSVCGIAVSALSWQSGAVNQSSLSQNSFSRMGPIPVAAIGVGGYLLLALLAWFHRRGWMLLFAWIGLGFAAYLSYLEAYVLQTWRLSWVISQSIIALIAILAATAAVTDAIKKISGTVSGMVDWVVTNLRYG